VGSRLYSALLYDVGFPAFTTFYLFELLIHFISFRFFPAGLQEATFVQSFIKRLYLLHLSSKWFITVWCWKWEILRTYLSV